MEFGHLITGHFTPKNIHQVWLGGMPIPATQLAYMEAIKKQCQESGYWNYYLWTDENIESLGITQSMLKFGSHAANSNLVRLIAIYQNGGIYLDTDCQVIGDLQPLLYYGAWAAQQVDGLICNACFGARKGHPWLLWQILNYDACTQDDAGCGPRTMTRAPRDGVTLIDPRICYPFSWDTLAADRLPHPKSLIVHHWAKSWL